MDNKEKSEGSGRKHPLAWPDGHIYHDKSFAEFFNDIQNQLESIFPEISMKDASNRTKKDIQYSKKKVTRGDKP